MCDGYFLVQAWRMYTEEYEKSSPCKKIANSHYAVQCTLYLRFYTSLAQCGVTVVPNRSPFPLDITMCPFEQYPRVERH